MARQTVLNHFPHKTDFAKAWGEGRRGRLQAIGEAAADDETARELVQRLYAGLAEMNERERNLTRALLDSLTPTEVFSYIRAVPAAAIERGQEQASSASPLTRTWRPRFSPRFTSGPSAGGLSTVPLRLISGTPLPSASTWCSSACRFADRPARGGLWSAGPGPVSKHVSDPSREVGRPLRSSRALGVDHRSLVC